MKHQLILATVLAATSLAGPALSADLAYKAQPVAAPIQYADWSGVYVGLEGGYGWGKQSSMRPR
jgi:outer membrane immunogenic protein